jgi:hypothetical protein
MRSRGLSASLLVAALTLSVGAAAPGPPTDLAATVTGNTVSLSWHVPATGQPETYVVAAALSPGGAVIANLTVTTNTVTVLNVPNGVYYVRVRALDLSGASELSNEVIIVVPSTSGGGGCSSAPNPPQNLIASAFGTIVMLDWSAPAGGCPATQYEVQAGSGPSMSNITVANVGALTALTGSAPAGLYYIRVIALNAFGSSGPSNEIQVVVSAPLPEPTPDIRDVIEALFLGTGSLARVGNPGCNNAVQRMRGWPNLSQVRIVTYENLEPRGREVSELMVQQANETFGTTLPYEFRPVGGDPNSVKTGEIGVMQVEPSQFPAQCQSTAGCHLETQSSPGMMASSRVILPIPLPAHFSGLIAHELGHAFGLCHIDPTRAGLDPALSVMGLSLFQTTRWTPIDMQAFRLVYGAGLRPGDERQKFITAGLIR